MPRLSKIGAAALAAFGWTGLQSVTASYLVVAGGGGGGTNNSAGDGGCGGGGAGGYRTGTEALNPTQSYSVIVGAGGASGAPDAAGSNGSSSVFLTTTSAGGGGGGDSQNGVKRAGDGGSGGGAGYINSAAGSGNTPSTSPSQGNNGGSYSSGDHGAGGGGATAAGSNTAGSPGAGGAGTANSISGSSVTYAGGGGGGGYNTTGASGGSGGGGQGGSNGAAGISGTANLGGGGGGGGGGSSPPTVGGNGGAGVVIISYVGAQQFGGGVVTSSGGNTIHTFTTSGTLSPLNSLTASYLIVAGGGGGAATFGGGYGGGGGGGAGGLLSGSGVTIDTNSIYAVTVGASGAGGASAGAVGTNGGNSTFSMVTTTAVGGGGGASYPGATGVGNGGSGGGVGYGGGTIASGGTGISGQGFAGGGKVSAGSGGGGGAGSVGGNGSAGGSGTFPETGGNGGSGLQNPITGSTTGQLSGGIYYVAGGGGGGGYENGGNGLNGGTASAGGGAGGGSAVAGSAGTASTGGGGGGGGGANLGTHYNGGNGGSGIVIISYPGSTQQMAGGTVTVAGGNVIHTFTSSGYLTPIVLVNNSLRFRESASSYLNRTPTTAGNNQKFTMSVWYKPGNIGTSFTNANFISAGGDGSNIIIAGSGAFGSTVDNRFLVRENNATAQFYWPMVFRDPAAWYHIVLAVDTTQTNSNNRAKLYVNGVDQGAFSGTGYSLSATTSFNTVTAHYIGAFNSAYYYTSCYFAEYNWIDGQQLTANSFGTSNGLGVWQPIRYGGSYGTNGFYLPFPNSGAVTANYLVVAGGGGGGIGGAGGGGGAGGLRSTVTATGGGGSLESALTLNAGNSYTVTVGAGGAGGISEALGTSGSNSVFSTITSTGGGGGSYASSSGGTPLGSGALSGGSGGGGSAWRNSIGTTSTQSNAAGTANQGFAGGSAPTQSTNSIGTGGGGGGAGAVGADAVQNTSSGNGGAGVAVAISGSSVTYGGGGGGGGANATAGTGGSGGGGNGANGSAGSSGTANLGGGGGGGSSGSGGSGGSGVVIVSYAGTPKFTGGVVSQVGGNTIHTFTTSGTLNGIGSDYSPNGNNWTPNNFSFSSGSTYDSMTDVPTLTSATTANYAVWNPLILARNFDTNPQTITNGNLVSQFTSNTTAGKFGGASTIGVTSGKWYCEIVVTEGGTYPTYTNFGITGDPLYNATVTNASIGQQDYSVGWYNANGNVYRNGSSLFSGSTQGSPYTAMIALDVSAGKVYFGFGGTWINSANPASGTGGFDILAVSSTPTGQYFITCFFASTGMQGSYALNCGQQPFAHTPPTGFVALNTYNLPTPTIGATASTTANKYMDVSTYTGNGGTLSVTNSGSMQPDWVWVKSRSTAQNNYSIDAVRGINSILVQNNTNSESTYDATWRGLYGNLTSFNSNGFTVVDGTDPSFDSFNGSGATYVGWQWKANGTGVTNTAGSIISTVSANTTAGFSIVTYTGNATSGATVGHGLGVAPSLMFVKVRNATARWVVYQKDVITANNQFLELNSTTGVDTSGTNFWTISSINSTTFGLGTNGDTNGSTLNFVAYCFAPVAGYSAFGTYTGNGVNDGPFIYTGFRPRWLFVKKAIGGTSYWQCLDTSRSPYNLAGEDLIFDLPDTEKTIAQGFNHADILSNGFKIRNTNCNDSGSTYIFGAFAESPFKYANAR